MSSENNMSRREFLYVAGLAAAALGLSSCANRNASANSESGVSVDPETVKHPSDFYGCFHYEGDPQRFVNADKFRSANEGEYVFVHSKGELYGTPLEFDVNPEGKIVASSISEWYVDEELEGQGVVNRINPHFYQREENGKVAITVLPPEYGFPVIVRKEGGKDNLYFAGVDSSHKIIHGPFDFFVSPGELAVRYGYEEDPNEVAAVSMSEVGSQLSGQLLVVPFSGEAVALKFVGDRPTEKVDRSKSFGEIFNFVDIESLNK